MVGTIKKYVSRYVVPFYFDYENDGYSKINKFFSEEKKDFKAMGLPKDCKWIKRGFWENYKTEESTQPEMDIYTYLLEILGDENDITNNNNLGASYVLKTDGSLFSLQYVKEEEKGVIVFKGTDLGVLLFRNGIGFVWYDIEFGKNISTDEYVDFQHDFKELARTHSDKFRKKIGKDEYDIFCLGKWIAQLLDVSSLGIKFWAERRTVQGNNDVSIPDKALLFQYLFIDTAEENERMDLAFRVANGYDTKYNSPSILKDGVYEPFGNSCFYTSKTGTAYVVSDNESNATFFEDNFKGKYIRDYFFIYVLLLYQTYSCAHYSRLLTKLPSEVKAIESDKKYIEQLGNLHSQINLFLIKSTYESVSNIQHQNGAYIYGKETLRIEEDMKSLTVGLEALRVMEVERQKAIDEDVIDKKDRALNKGLVVFGFMVVVSAAIDALNFVDWFEDHTMNWGHCVLLGIIALLTIFMFVVLIVNTRRKK